MKGYRGNEKQQKQQQQRVVDTALKYCLYEFYKT